jgi:hypothetical protein
MEERECRELQRLVTPAISYPRRLPGGELKMGSPPPSPPVITLSGCCPNGVQLSSLGLPS